MRWDGKKDQDVSNEVKLSVIFRNQGAFKKRLFLRAKHMGASLSVRGTMVTGTVLAATEFLNFYVLVITLTPLTSKINLIFAYIPFQCVTRSDAST